MILAVRPRTGLIKMKYMALLSSYYMGDLVRDLRRYGRHDLYKEYANA